MDRSEKYFTSTNDMLVFYLFLVLPAYTIGIDDGNGLSYHKNINATCVEKQLADRFSGWELDLPKPIDEIEVKISKTKTSTSQIYLKSFIFPD